MSEYDQFQEAQILTAPSYHLHRMVVEGAIKQGRIAMLAIQEGRFDQSHSALGKARDLVAELIAGLDRSRDPDLVERLHAFFLIAYCSLLEADVNRDTTAIRDALDILQSHHETWMQLISELKEADAPSGMSSRANPGLMGWAG